MSTLKKSISFLVLIASTLICGGALFYFVEGDFIAGVWHMVQVWLAIFILLYCFLAVWKLVSFFAKD